MKNMILVVGILAVAALVVVGASRILFLEERIALIEEMIVSATPLEADEDSSVAQYVYYSATLVVSGDIESDLEISVHFPTDTDIYIHSATGMWYFVSSGAGLAIFRTYPEGGRTATIYFQAREGEIHVDDVEIVAPSETEYVFNIQRAGE